MEKISNELIQYISGFIDGKFYFVDQMYMGKTNYLSNNDLDSWYARGYKDANNYYMNKLSHHLNQNDFIKDINKEDINPVIEDFYSQYKINDKTKVNK